MRAVVVFPDPLGTIRAVTEPSSMAAQSADSRHYCDPVCAPITGAPEGWHIVVVFIVPEHDTIGAVEEDRLLRASGAIADQGLHGLPVGSSVMAYQERASIPEEEHGIWRYGVDPSQIATARRLGRAVRRRCRSGRRTQRLDRPRHTAVRRAQG